MKINILLLLKIVQIKKEKNALGKNYQTRRLNPYNPLTYLFILLIFIIGIVLFGFIGFWNQIDLRDLNFKFR